MEVYEIENMDTHEQCFVSAETEQEMKTALKSKGFTEVAGMFFAGLNDKGQEVSAMPATFIGVNRLNHINPQ